MPLLLAGRTASTPPHPALDTSWKCGAESLPSQPSGTPDSAPWSQVIRARMQQRQDAARGAMYSSGWHALRVTLRREGPLGLYRGLLPNVLRVMPQSAITFLVYENVMQLLAARPQRRTSA